MSFIGIGVGVALAPTLGTIGAGVAGGVVGGAATSAIVSAAQGKPITAKDVLIGAGTGAVTGGVGGALAAPAKIATEAGKIGGQAAVKTGTEAATKAGTEAATKAGTEAATKVGTDTAGKLTSHGTGELASQAGGQGFDKVMGATRTGMPAGFSDVATAPTGGVANLPTSAPNMGLSSVAKVNPNAIASPTSGLSSGNVEGSSIGANTFNNAMANPATEAPVEGMFGSSVTSGSKGFDTALEKLGVEGLMSGGKEGLGAIQTSRYNAGVKKADQEAQAAGAANAGIGQNMANDLYSNQMKAPMLAAKGGSIHAAKGGSIHMDSGSFVIPADIVSALGDGSTEAGFRFLESFFKDAEAE